KLIFSTLFLLTMLVTSQTQTFQLDYYIENFSSTDTWGFQITDDNGGGISSLVGPGSPPASGTINMNALFPIDWSVSNGSCSYQDQDNGAVPQTLIPFSGCSPTPLGG